MTLGYVLSLCCNLNESAFSGISLPSQTAYSRVQAKMHGRLRPDLHQSVYRANSPRGFVCAFHIQIMHICTSAGKKMYFRTC